MRLTALALLAASSLLWLGVVHAASRPRYGGTLHVEMRAAPQSLDPADVALSGSLQGSNVSSLIFDTLVTLDDRGTPQPALATSWQPEPGNQRWQFKLRHGIAFQDGTTLTADQVAASLRVANPSWKILPEGDEIIIERDSPAPDLPAELAKARNGIAKRGGATILGTGPYAISGWDAGKKLTLAANNDYWGGRPFLDSVEIMMGQGFREQMISLDLGNADLIEVAPEQAHRAAAEGRHIENSAVSELMALVFTRDRLPEDEAGLREALALSIDRTALSAVLLQGGAEPAVGLLPNWMTGYEFVFSMNAAPNAPMNASPNTNLAGAKQDRGQVRQTSPWTLAYDANNPVAQVVAERLALNARDAGVTVQLANANNPNLRLVRVPIVSLDARVALADMAESLRLPQPRLAGSSSEDLYAAESTLLQAQQVIPLLHLCASYATGVRARNWSEAPNGSWHLGEVWLSAEK